MRQKIINAALMSALLPTLSFATLTTLAPPANTQDDTFTPFMRKLGHKTSLPIRLPRASELNAAAFHYHTSDIALARKEGYWVNFDYTPDCQGAPVCSAGNLIVTHTTSQPLGLPMPFALTPTQIKQMTLVKTDLASINSQHATLPQINHFTTVMLSPTMPAYLSQTDPHAENATSFQTLAWVNHNCYFQLTLKNTSVKQLINAARDTQVHLNSRV